MAKRITEFTSATSLAEGDLLALVDVSDTTQATSGTTKKSPLSLIADYLKVRVDTLTNKTLSTNSVIDSSVDVVEVLKKVYPVGSIYINANVSTNPATLMGFGTWEAFGQGRVMVGKNTSGTFATAGATGGAETHTLSVNEMPSHTHTLSNNTLVNRNIAGTGGSQGSTTVLASTITIANTGGGSAHNNLQPYIVAYLWKRLT